MEKLRKRVINEENIMSTIFKCIFCHLETCDIIGVGKLCKKPSVGLAAHYHCLVFSTHLRQKQNERRGIRGFDIPDICKCCELIVNQKCMFCGLDSANIGCCHSEGCDKTFHLPCGLTGGAVHQFFGQFQSFCPQHRPIQRTPKTAVADICSICLQGWQDDTTDNNDFGEEKLWASCCKYSNAFHRKCIQQLAVTSGYFFKCPCCKNKDVFARSMRKFGIYVPLEDPTWHLEREAYEEMTQPPKLTCSARPCMCTLGQSYSCENTSWEMVKCCVCAAEGIHKSCGGFDGPELVTWQCRTCAPVVAPRTRFSKPISSVPLPKSKIDGLFSSGTEDSQDADSKRQRLSDKTYTMTSSPGFSGTTSCYNNILEDAFLSMIFKVDKNNRIYEMINTKYEYHSVFSEELRK